VPDRRAQRIRSGFGFRRPVGILQCRTRVRMIARPATLRRAWAVVVRGSAPLDVLRSYPQRVGRRGLSYDANMGSRSTARACPVQRSEGLRDATTSRSRRRRRRGPSRTHPAR
jgi:hypothetical protein